MMENSISKLLFFSSFSLFVSCSNSPQEKLISAAEDFVVLKFQEVLKDPESYSLIKTEIEDTVYRTDELNAMISQEDTIIEMTRTIDELFKDAENSIGVKESGTDSTEGSKIFLNSRSNVRDSLKELLEGTDKSKISYILLSHSYRAKNGFGALDIGNVKLKYFPDDQKFDLIPMKKK